MEPSDEISLEEILVRGLRRAREWFEADSLTWVEQTLLEIGAEYKRRGVAVPLAVFDLRREIDSEMEKGYPDRIAEAIAENNYSVAVRLFVPMVLKYNREERRIPLAYWKIRNDIARISPDDVFEKIYARTRFEED